ncbi:MAG: SUF system NifU family Fe-S cluster assembly protein [Planctomycetes bacterium]|nr:SUF system NifU family Fe-S cluster assembly protein [Planctomycetota bacterium]
MSDLRELYQEVILEHSKRPRCFGSLEQPTCSADGRNPLCGDHLTLGVQVEGDVIRDIAFKGAGCAISTASASLMATAVKGKPRPEVEALFQRVHAMLTSPVDQPVDTEGLGKLKVFAGVREFPARVKCASLAWHTLKAALDGTGAASTE